MYLPFTSQVVFSPYTSKIDTEHAGRPSYCSMGDLKSAETVTLVCGAQETLYGLDHFGSVIVSDLFAELPYWVLISHMRHILRARFTLGSLELGEAGLANLGV